VALGCRHLSLVPIVVVGRRNLRVKRHMKVIVEIAGKRGKPRNAPFLFRFVGVELGQRPGTFVCTPDANCLSRVCHERDFDGAKYRIGDGR